LLRAASQYTRRFLTSERSLDASIPDDPSQVLRPVALMPAMPGQATGRQILLRHIQAFDPDGNPAIELEAHPPGRLATAASRVAQDIATVANLATVAAIIGVLVLLALHRLDIVDVLHFLRGNSIARCESSGKARSHDPRRRVSRAVAPSSELPPRHRMTRTSDKRLESRVSLRASISRRYAAHLRGCLVPCQGGILHEYEHAT
jgi:hypothetical protein